MITRAQVDALAYGDVVLLKIDRRIYQGPVTGSGGQKIVQGRMLRDVTGSSGQQNSKGKSNTGYPEYVLKHGTLTVIKKAP